MSRPRKLALIAAGSLAGLLVIAIAAGIVVVRTEWFRERVRTTIVNAVEGSTGGRAEIGSFHFEWTRFRAVVRNFVLHGSEPAGESPLFRADLLQVDLKLTSALNLAPDISYLLAERPQANIIVFSDGRTNIPSPKIKKEGEKSGLETVVDLAIGRFDLRSGDVTFNQQKTAFSAHGRNLRAELGYDALNSSYTGALSISPLLLRSGNAEPVNVNVKVPVTVERDKVTVSKAELTTAESHAVISGTVENMASPRTSASVNARLAIDELKRAAGLSFATDTTRGPRLIEAEATAFMGDGRIDIRSARLSLGNTNLEASGTLQDPSRPGSLAFAASLSLDELGRLFRMEAQPQGAVRVGGNATLQQNNEYVVRANVTARNVAVTQGGTRLSGIAFDSSVTASPNRIAMGGVKLSALGGSFSGSGALENLQQFRVSGDLRNLDLDQLTRTFTREAVGYGGVVSGPVQGAGDVKNISAVVARANLAVTPTNRGIPVSGRLNVHYNGRADAVNVSPSYLQLPHTRADISGSLGRTIKMRLVSHDLADFKPVANIPVTLNGAAVLDATITGRVSDPRIAGQVSVGSFSVQGRRFTGLTAALDATQSSAVLKNGFLTRGPMQAQFSGSAGLRDWKVEANSPIRLDAAVRNADAADVIALAGRSEPRVAGALTADAHLSGTAGSPVGNAEFSIVKGAIEGEPFDALDARVIMNGQSIEIPTFEMAAGASRITANAVYRHAADNLRYGALRAHVASNQVDLAAFQSLAKNRPGLAGTLSLNADAVAHFTPGPSGTQVQIESINGNASARALQMEGRNLGDFTASARTAGSAVQYTVASNFAGSNILVNGQSLLTGDHETTATAQIADLPIDRVLAFAGRKDVPVNGMLGATARVSGTLRDPRAEGTITVSDGAIYGERFSRLQADARYSNTLVELPAMRLTDGPSTIDLRGSFAHPPGDLRTGQVRFDVKTNQIQLAVLELLQQRQPGLAGAVELEADGAATLRSGAPPLFSTLNAKLVAKGVSLRKRPIGNLTASAVTRGSNVDLQLVADFAGSDIRGSGRMQLTDDYPVDAKVAFSRLTYSGLSAWTESPAPELFDASAAGEIQLAGNAANLDALRGALRLTTLEAHSTPGGQAQAPRVQVQLRNQGDIVVALERSVLTVRSFKIAGPDVNLSVAGYAPLRGQSQMNVTAEGNIELKMLEAFSADLFTSGTVTLKAAVSGEPAQPVVNGRLQLQNASFNSLRAPLGIANANGAVLFTGREAVLQNVTAEAGGGKVTLAGTAGYGGNQLRVRLQANADRVRVTYPENVNTEFNARLTLAGTSARSLLSGNVSVTDLALTSQSDVGSMLSSAAAPPASPRVSTGFLAGMRFDVKVITAPGLQIRTNLTQNLRAEANMSLRGSPDHPGMLGRILATGGEVVFFGSTYEINQGTVTFNNPERINPIVNIDLSTTAQGVDVTLSVSGPMDRLKLSYRSDPPMLFSDLVSLLASGKPPTTDPVLAARQSVAPQQTFEQRGASTLLGQAVANPVSGRLQRLFGVSRLKIDPQITGTSNTPQATMTLQQQITRDLTFTYIQDITQSNPQAVRVEWAISPQWSAIAQRDLNGMFDLDFFYKKRFR